MSHRPLPSLPSGHLRRRSMTDSESVELLPPSSSRQSFSALRPEAASSALEREPSSTVIEFEQAGARSAEYYALHDDDKLELDERARADDRGRDGHAWRNKKQPPRPPGGRRFPKKGLGIALSLLGTGGVVGWLAGASRGGSASAASLGGVKNAVHDISLLAESGVGSRVCNPYTQHGVLNVSLETPSENVWQPVAAPDGCEAVDYMTLLQDVVRTGDVDGALEFARGRTIAILGDSVDRDHVTDFCQLVGARPELIGPEHPLSPPYPEGQEIPDKDYHSYQDGQRVWPANEQSRPWVCRVEELDLLVMNVFHYGFRERTAFIDNHPHGYPPFQLEDRFDQILLPLLSSLAAQHGRSAVPDVFSVTSGFWGMMRQAVEDDRKKEQDVEDGMTEADAAAKWDTWRSMPTDVQRYNERRIEEVVKHVGGAWEEAEVRPRILWRALHHIRPHHLIPSDRLQSLDQIGRAVVEHLVLEGLAATQGGATWRAWVHRQGKKWLPAKWTATRNANATSDAMASSGEAEEGAEARAMGLGRRLKIDEWGSRMLGQEMHFRDEVHPAPLPGSWLYGNMAMEQLKLEVEAREADAVRGQSLWG